jgi:hypothetical protein
MRAPLERLSAILHAFEGAGRDRARMETLLMVLAAEPFDGAALFFGSQDGMKFLLLASWLHSGIPSSQRATETFVALAILGEIRAGACTSPTRPATA